MVFRPRLETKLRRVKEAGFGFFSGGDVDMSRRVFGGAVRRVMRTLCSLSERGVKTLVVLRERAGVKSVVGANADVSNTVSERLLVGVFVPGAPLRSKTIIVESTRVGTTTYFLPLARSGSLDGSLNAERETTMKMDRISSYVSLVMSRRAKSMSVTGTNGLCEGVSGREVVGVLEDGLGIAARRGNFFGNKVFG